MPRAVSHEVDRTRPTCADECDSSADTSSHQLKKDRLMVMISIVGGTILLVLLVIAGLLLTGILPSLEEARMARLAEQDAGPKKELLPKGTGEEDLLNFVPKDCSIFLGFDSRFGTQHPEFTEWLRETLRKQWVLNSLPSQPVHAFAEADRALLAYTVVQHPVLGFLFDWEGVVVVRRKRAYEPKPLRTMLRTQEPEEIDGKTVYPFPILPGNHRLVVYMPNDRILVLAFGHCSRIPDMLKFNGTTPVLGSRETSIVRKLEKAYVWFAVLDPRAFQRQLKDRNPQQMLNDFEASKIIDCWSAALETAPLEKARLHLDYYCRTNAGSERVKTGCKSYWSLAVPIGVNWIKSTLLPDIPQMSKQLQNEVSNSFAVRKDGLQVTVEAQVSAKVLQMMSKRVPEPLTDFINSNARRPAAGKQPVQDQRPAKQAPVP
jgi:hypothetical protein